MSRTIFRSTIASLLLLLCLSIRAQGAPAPAAYANSPEGLRQFLSAVLSAARSRGPDAVDAALHDMEIPGAGKWLPHTFGRKSGAERAAAYAGDLSANEALFKQVLLQLAAQNAEFTVRRVNSAPRGDELYVIGNLSHFVNIYEVSYYAAARSAAAGEGEPLVFPYFYFIAGKFRCSFDSHP